MASTLSLDAVPGLSAGTSPLYLQIAEGMERLIRSHGKQAIGQALPSENECVRHFGVHRLTVRQAMAALGSRGLITKYRGRGTFVSALPLDHDIGRAFEDEMRAGGRNATVRLLEWKRVACTEDLARIFSADGGTQLYRLRRLRLIEGRVVGLEERYLPTIIGDRIAEGELRSQSPFALLRRLTGEKSAQMRFAVSGGIADAGMAKLLGVRRGTPLLVRKNTCYFPGDRALMHGTVTFVARNYQFRFNVTMDLVA